MESRRVRGVDIAVELKILIDMARVENPVPDAIGDAVVSAIIEYERKLQRGALITLDPDRLRARILPIISPK